MNPLSVFAVKLVGGAGAAALLTLGLAGGIAQASSGSASPTPAAGSNHRLPDPRSDHRAVARAVFESEADVLGITPKTLRQDLRKGLKVSDLARDKGMTEEQFETRLIASVKSRLEGLVSQKVITQAQADRVLDRIAKGHIPFWNGVHHRTK